MANADRQLFPLEAIPLFPTVTTALFIGQSPKFQNGPTNPPID
jgi:hypothetical protein